MARWRFSIDRGGTFTDCIGEDPTGRCHVTKVLSGPDAPLRGIRALLGLPDDAPIPPCDVRLGTTLATNALLERRGTACALVVTRGFGDIVRIGDQSRPELFAPTIVRPPVLYDAVLEVDARADPAGRVLARPDPATTRPALAQLHARGIGSVAIVILHGHRAPDLERELGEWARAVGFSRVSLSHEVAPETGLLGRADTTLVDAYLTPVLQHYLADLARALPGSRLRLMQSSGGLTSPARLTGHNAILSGPAGGAIACAAIARRWAPAGVIGLDMGGTSTDVCRAVDPTRTGEDTAVAHAYETSIAGVRVRSPMVQVHTIAAGGGSICRLHDGRLTVGPDSAGATPGPLCYGDRRARALALTDVNLVLGRLHPRRFALPLQPDRAHAALQAIADAVGDRSAAQIAEGFFDVAVEQMAGAIRRVSIERGHDASAHGLVVFGGAGAQHACAVARRLRMRTIWLHPLAGVMSAWGIGLAPVTWHGAEAIGPLPLSRLSTARAAAGALVERGRAQLAVDDGVTPDAVHELALVDVRYVGTDVAITLPLGEDEADDPTASLTARFAERYAQRFGFTRPDRAIELTAVRVELTAGGTDPETGTSLDDAPEARSSVPTTQRLWHGGRWHDAAVIDRETLAPGAALDGPALVLDDTATTVVEPGWRLTMHADGMAVLTDEATPPPPPADTRRDEVRLSLFAHRFMSIAEQMGAALRRTAVSTNIRERLDFSCAVFDRDGGLVANAPHMPVHLGAMGETVAAVARAHPTPSAGDVFASNDPALGGSHLPDITVVTPVFVDGVHAFFVASRGHHADVGGRTPGSMPPRAATLAEEGVVLSALPIARAGRFDDAAVVAALSAGPYPARAIADNVADLQAQIAANQLGSRLLQALCADAGTDVVHAYMGHLQDQAATAVQRAIAQLPDTDAEFSDTTDDGTTIAVRLRIRGGTMDVDFTGTSGRHAGNLNAPRAVTIAAVLYVLRCLVDEPIPLNRGCLRPVTITITPGSLLDPPPDAAVAAGNVETSQRVVDVLWAALGRSAACQGTMNNLTFGDEHFGYYETIGGGEGAREGHHGTGGVHTHMTNTRITDPEIVESRFPVRLQRFCLRRGSGGDGRFVGGDGLVRTFEALAPLTVSILSDRREVPPFGLHGGAPAAPGRNRIAGKDVPGRAQVEVTAGDIFEIATPGGGGYGSPAPES